MIVYQRNQQTTLPNDRRILYIALILFSVAFAYCAETVFLWASRYALEAQLDPSSPDPVLLGEVLDRLYPVATALGFIPWGFVSDRFGPRSAYIRGILLWALGTFATAWSVSAGFLLIAVFIQAAGFAALLPAALSAVTKLSPRNHGMLVGLICAFHGLFAVTVELLPIDMESAWRMTLLLAPVVALLPALLGWLAFPPSPSDVAITPPARPRHSLRKRFALAQTLLFGAFLYAIKFYLGVIITPPAGMYIGTYQYRLIEIPSMIGLAAGFILGGAIAGKREVTRLAWLIAAAGAAIALPQLSFPDTLTVLGVTITAAGTGLGLLGQLLTLLRPTARNLPGLLSGLFQTAQIIANGMGVGMPLLLAHSLVAVGIDSQVGLHAFPGFSLLLLITGLVLAVISRNRETSSGVEGP